MLHHRRALPNGIALAASLATSLVLLGACADEPTSPRLASPRRDAAPDSVLGAVADSTLGSASTAITPAPRARWTVMVYLAADNNLAPAAVADLDELEAGVAALRDTTDTAAAPAVQVVVQGELSQTYMRRAGCADPSCVGLPSWNTFRYAVAGRAVPDSAPHHGPTGPVVDLGEDRDLTRPETLRDFVAWSKEMRPADHYLLVLWSHGGGYAGVVSDETSAGSGRMTVDGVRQALADAGPVDVVDFDLSLAGSYETLAKLAGVAHSAVFSEAVTPAAGNDYAALLRGLGESIAAGDAAGDAASSADSVAAMVVDRYHAAHVGGRETTTISAYDLDGFTAFETSLDALADGLRERLTDSTRAAATAAAIHGAVAAGQRFDYAPLHDLVDVLDSLDVRSRALGDSDLAGLVDDARTRATASDFRIHALAQTGAAPRALPVERASGLGIVWPSGDSTDAVRDAGPSSLDAYAALLPDHAWTRFLATYLAAVPTTAAVDQADRAMQLFLLWDADAAGVDIDLWVLEPDGRLYIPYLGRVTPNGELTADSWDTGTGFEGWATNRFVTRGTYRIFASLVQDSLDVQPRYDLAYRHGVDERFSLYFETLPRLSFEHSYAADSSATLDKAAEGAYSDLQLVATWTPGADGGDGIGSAPLPDAALSRTPLRPSAAQLATARRLTAAFRARRAPSAASARAHGLVATGRPLRALGLPKRTSHR